MLFLRQLSEHVLDVANLHRLGADGVVDAHEHQQDHQNVGVHKGVDLTSPSDEHLVQIGHRCFLSESAPGPATWIAFQTGSPFCGRIQQSAISTPEPGIRRRKTASDIRADPRRRKTCPYSTLQRAKVRRYYQGILNAPRKVALFSAGFPSMRNRAATSGRRRPCGRRR